MLLVCLPSQLTPKHSQTDIVGCGPISGIMRCHWPVENVWLVGSYQLNLQHKSSQRAELMSSQICMQCMKYTRTGPCCLNQTQQAAASPPARPEQRLVKNVWPVGGCQHHNACSRLEAIHLHQQLVKRVLTLIIAAGKATSATCSANGINFICRQAG